MKTNSNPDLASLQNWPARDTCMVQIMNHQDLHYKLHLPFYNGRFYHEWNLRSTSICLSMNASRPPGVAVV